MNLLYLTEDYNYTKVHNNLLNHMLEHDANLKIYVFTPFRPRIGEKLSNSFVHNDRLIEIEAPIDIPAILYRFDFWAKIRCKVRLIEKNIPIDEIDVIHAATLFTEGCTARALQKKYGIPFFVSVRATDSIFYSKKMPHLWKNGYDVLKYANSIAYVTPTIKSSMLSKWQYRELSEKLMQGDIVNNGIDRIWLDNLHVEPKNIDTPIRILYIGRFDSKKNILGLIDAVKRLRERYLVSLILVGGDGDKQAQVEHEVNENNNYVEYLGKIYDKDKLIEVVRGCDIFAMLSHEETFGLVYAECLSQGLPLVYSKGTGFDNMYPDGHVGYSAYSNKVDSIVDALQNVIINYQSVRINVSNVNFERFSWPKLAQLYLQKYEVIKTEKS